MKRLLHLRSILMASLLILSILACNFDLAALTSGTELSAEQTLDAVSTMAAATLQAMDQGDGSDTAPSSEDSSSEEAAPEATPSPTVEIIHLTNPGDPASTSYYVIDSSSASYGPEGRTISDSFSNNRMERSLDADGMVYQPYLDIVRAELFISSPWVYLTIFLEGAPPADSAGWYAMEIDLDMDGRGNVLVAAQLPPDTSWTTDGVKVFKDANFDVGGARPMQNDSPPQAGDGYETVLFDSGIGDDPDAAWARIAPGHTDRVQLGFKYSLLNSDGEFLWGAWTDEGLQEAGWFDYHDHFTHAEAGSPLSESSNYPLAAMDSMDNTCRWSYGFQPTEPLPGLCDLPTTPTPTPTPTQTATPTDEPTGVILGRVFNDINDNDAHDSPDIGFTGVTVHLWEGSCGGSGHQTTTTLSDGWFRFTGLDAGTYCIKVYHDDLPYTTYGWFNTVPNTGTADPTRTVNLPTPGSTYNTAHFGFAEIIG